MATYAVREALLEAGGSCVGPREQACLARFIATTQSRYAIVASVSGGDPASFQLTVSVADADGVTVASVSSPLKRTTKPNRPQMEAAFSALFARLELVSFDASPKTPAPPQLEPTAKMEPVPPPVVEPTPKPSRSPLLPVSYVAMGVGAAAAVTGAVLMALASASAAQLPTMNRVLTDASRIADVGRIDGQWFAGQGVLFGGLAVAAGGLLLFILAAPWATAEEAQP